MHRTHKLRELKSIKKVRLSSSCPFKENSFQELLSLQQLRETFSIRTEMFYCCIYILLNYATYEAQVKG